MNIFLDLVVLAAVIWSGVWTYRDAEKFEAHDVKLNPGAWCVGVLLLWIVFFPTYLFRREGYKKMEKSSEHKIMDEKNAEAESVNQKEEDKKSPITAIVISVIIVVVVLGLIALAGSGASNSDNTTASVPSGCSNPTLEQQAQSVDYKQLEKDPNSLNGTIAKFTGQVLQIQQSNGQGVIRLAVTKITGDLWSASDVVYVTYQGNTNAVQDDIVTVYGPLTGAQTYTSQANFQITIPSMTGCMIEEASSSPSAEVTPSAPAATTQIQPQTQTPTQPIATKPTPAPQTPVAPKTWHTVTTVTAATTENTPPFSIQGKEWRATWSCQPGASEDVPPSVFAQATDGNGGDMLATPSSCLSNNVTYFYDGPANDYLDITSLGGDSITVTIEDYY